ncbi:4-hydroxythreonine-4-phosphate dehydrogenase PdxA [Nesterenkonia halobia]|uniref:4-hydroxythreonine-4-phosphate dehydrogenase PdxA n=1 Tax=Nesterenkonia halobia TaxID=37922 RepID=A0ABP6RMM8_9MICC
MSVQNPIRPRLAVTIGDPSGIGPELVAKLLASQKNRDQADIYVLATDQEITTAATEIGVSVPVSGRPSSQAVTAVGSTQSTTAVPRGEATVAGGRRALADLQQAVQMYRRGEVDGIMFAPLNKSALGQAGMNQDDELRWFAELLDYKGTTSELNLVPGLTTSRVTSHIPLSQVAEHISARGVLEAIKLLHSTIRGFGTEKPRIAVCALNPHAGEGGKFGHEEVDHIAPGVELAQVQGIDASGPYPCDTLFIKAHAGDYDGVVTMYHDQGQIAMKLMGFDQGVTVQGGLPVPIATPAHGTAYQIVGEGIANIGPSQRAFDTAVSLASQNLAAQTHNTQGLTV